MTTGLLIVSLYLGGMPINLGIIILGCFLTGAVGAEVARLRNPAFNEKCIRFFAPIIRLNEVDRISGMPYYIASAMFAIGVFPKPVAVLSLLYLALGDPIASLVGILYKGRSLSIMEGKSFHGTFAAFSVCAVTTWVYLSSTGMHGLNLIRLTLLGGFAGALAELLPLDIDDNLTIPIVSGFILWVGFIAIHFI